MVRNNNNKKMSESKSFETNCVPKYKENDKASQIVMLAAYRKEWIAIQKELKESGSDEIVPKRTPRSPPSIRLECGTSSTASSTTSSKTRSTTSSAPSSEKHMRHVTKVKVTTSKITKARTTAVKPARGGQAKASTVGTKHTPQSKGIVKATRTKTTLVERKKRRATTVVGIVQEKVVKMPFPSYLYFYLSEYESVYARGNLGNVAACLGSFSDVCTKKWNSLTTLERAPFEKKATREQNKLRRQLAAARK